MAALRVELGNIKSSTYSGKSTLVLLCWHKKLNGEYVEQNIELTDLTFYDLRILVRNINSILADTESAVSAIRGELMR